METCEYQRQKEGLPWKCKIVQQPYNDPPGPAALTAWFVNQLGEVFFDKERGCIIIIIITRDSNP
jgi:hypothetical protein